MAVKLDEAYSKRKRDCFAVILVIVISSHSDFRTVEFAVAGVLIRTVLVRNISLAVTQRDMKEFFSFSGEIDYIDMQSHLRKINKRTTLKERELPPAGSAVKKAEDVVSSMLAKGFVLGKDALKRAKSFDERHNLVSNASATVASIDRKIGLSEKISSGTWMVSEKVREVDEHLQVSEITKSTIAAAEQTASSAGSALMSNQYVSTGASRVSSAFSMAVKAAGDVSIMTKEKNT
ncbi:hypothetical protein J5N97_030142 [Dioscorea zingiberensis]|uniref:Binding partner of ACD11 1 n=1 Tax=Dioscorea zingiberensis TaxID=325984 RepID=A0A9D5H3Z1_9LILI|nr:hypothetical protein J5N97_030142 [Dioscorea zingiberensis]